MATSLPPSSRNRRFRSARTPQQPRRGASRSGMVPWQGSQRSPRRHTVVQPSRFRLSLVWMLLLLAMLGLAANLMRLQVFQAPFLQEQARSQQVVNRLPFVPRRSIVDRMGNVVAIDRPVYTLYAHPVLFKQPASEIVAALTPVLEQDPNQLIQRLNQGESGIPIAHSLSTDSADQITALQIDGLELVASQERLYPQEELFANIVGYVDTEQKGQAGVEETLHDQLVLPRDTVTYTRTGDGWVLPNSISEGLIQTDDLKLQLTVDNRLQRSTRLKLREQMEKYDAKRGTVLVMDVRDGAMRALVSEPSYNPNRYYEADVALFRNWALSDLYEPGSTFKPINVAIALEEKAIAPDDVFVDEGSLQFGEWTIQNFDYTERGGRGPQSVQEIIKFSSNVGMVHIMQQVEPEVYYRWLEKIGLGQPTGIDLPYEAAGQIKDFEQFTTALIEPATTAFGQGFSLTPIQLVQLQASLANGGKLVVPHVVRGLVDSNGQEHWHPDRPAPITLFSPQTTRAVLSMMESVVADGTGENAQVPGYRIAGKTGTAQKASEYGGYANSRITSFVSLFPVDAPRYAVLVVIDEPQGDDAYGSTVAAPIAKSVMESLIVLDSIPPSAPIDPSSLEESTPSDSADPSLDPSMDEEEATF